MENYWGGHGEKWVWPLWSQDTKIGCISRRNQRNKLICGVLIKIQESQNLLWVCENGCGLLCLRTLKSAVSQE